METTRHITKDDERKALAIIRKIVDDLGDDSYISTTFMGVFEVAEQNIDNDFGINAIEHGIFFGKEAAKTEMDEMKTKIETLQQDLKRTGEYAEQHSKAADFNYDKCQEYKVKIEKLNAENKSLSNEVIKLKARLFDLIDNQ